jgi:osmotically-inducible protein OsmY
MGLFYKDLKPDREDKMNRNTLEELGLLRDSTRRETLHLTDAELCAAAVNAVESLTTIPSDSIRITAQDGWLRLEGEVDWQHQRLTVEELTSHLPGVRGVTNAINVRPQPLHADTSSVWSTAFGS